MTKQFIIRHKETQQQFFTSRGKKGSWKTAGHAKAAFTNKYAYQGGFRFDEQDVYEIVEVVSAEVGRLERAESLLSRAYDFLDNVHAYESDIANDIRKYFGSQCDE